MDRRDYYGNRERIDHAAQIKAGFILVRYYDYDEDQDGIEIEEKLPCIAEVCGTCNGKGTHVNPSIDAQGLTREDFDNNDPDFQENYFSGAYDVACYECRGNKVVAAPRDRATLNDAQKAIYDKWEAWEVSEAEYAAECEQERRMGY